MRLFLDTEFNGFGGDLISLALVDEMGNSFYESVHLPDVLDPWVREHVVPIIFEDPVPLDQLRNDLIKFLYAYTNPEIVTDWPSDVFYFSKVLLGDQHTDTFFYPCTFSIVSMKSLSSIPHNALHDAMGLREAYTKRNNSFA